MADEKKRCGKCACCKHLECGGCEAHPPKKKQTLEELLKKEIPKSSATPKTFGGSTPMEAYTAAYMGRSHAEIHGELAASAAAEGNVGLAHNEAASAAEGARVSEAAAAHLKSEVAADKKKAADKSQCCLRGKCGNPKCPLVDMENLANWSDGYAKDARGAANDAAAAAAKAGPNPGIPGTPSSPNLNGPGPAYPGGPPNPFNQPPGAPATTII